MKADYTDEREMAQIKKKLRAKFLQSSSLEDTDKKEDYPP